MAGNWIFKWYDPDQDLRPEVWLRAIGEPVPDPATLQPYVISDPSNGRRVRFRSLLGASGPPYVPVNQDIPFSPGSRLDFINVNDTEVDLRVLFTADSTTLLWAQLQDLPWRFNPKRGIGTLEVTNPSGAVRYLNCTCISGFKLDESTLQEKSVEAVLSFYANDPYWYSDWHVNKYFFTEYKIGSLPILPQNLSRDPTDNIAELNITNAGDANGYGVFIISGPYGNPILVNSTLTKPTTALNPSPQIYKLDCSANGGLNTLLANPSTLDFVNKTIIATNNDTGGLVNAEDTLTPQSTFWSLQHGNNVIYVYSLNIDENTFITVITRDTYSTMI